MEYVFHPIGTIHSPFPAAKGTPIQPRFAGGAEGTVEMFEEFAGGLDGLHGFSHIHLLYVFDRSDGFNLKVTPYLDDAEKGVFATRAPRRPNPLGLSVVRLVKIDGNVLYVEDLDVLDGTPLVDIKPFAAAFDHREDSRAGWLEKHIETARGLADGRFHQKKDDPDG